MRQRGWMFLVMAAMFLSLGANSALAAGGTGGISLSAGFTPIGGGDAGRWFGWFDGPTYDDVYDTGWTGRIEPYYDFHPMVRGQVGIAYNKWGGKTFDGVRFEDLKVTTYYVGVKVRFLPNSNIRPYAVADIGAARISSVSVTGLHGPGVQSQYWDSTTTGFVDIGGGVEFIVAPNVSFFVDLRAQGTGEPNSADPPDSEADGIGSVPFSAGVNFTF